MWRDIAVCSHFGFIAGRNVMRGPNQPLPSLIPSHPVMTQRSPNTLIYPGFPIPDFCKIMRNGRGTCMHVCTYCTIIRCNKGQASWTRLCYFPPSCAFLNPFKMVTQRLMWEIPGILLPFSCWYVKPLTLEVMLVWNYNLMTDLLTGVACRATSLSKKDNWDFNLGN